MMRESMRSCDNSGSTHSSLTVKNVLLILILLDIVEPDRLHMIQPKSKSLWIGSMDWPESRKVKDIQSFLGFANFYHHFIHNYSDITTPLTPLTHKGIPWEFSVVLLFNS
jgi:hypothetical protein